jgi:hypothetical protein
MIAFQKNVYIKKTNVVAYIMQLMPHLNPLFGFQENAAFIYFRVTIKYFKSKINYVVLRKEVVGKSSINLRAFPCTGSRDF